MSSLLVGRPHHDGRVVGQEVPARKSSREQNLLMIAIRDPIVSTSRKMFPTVAPTVKRRAIETSGSKHLVLELNACARACVHTCMGTHMHTYTVTSHYITSHHITLHYITLIHTCMHACIYVVYIERQ